MQTPMFAAEVIPFPSVPQVFSQGTVLRFWRKTKGQFPGPDMNHPEIYDNW